jgi:hypothetical protein
MEGKLSSRSTSRIGLALLADLIAIKKLRNEAKLRRLDDLPTRTARHRWPRLTRNRTAGETRLPP